MVAEKDNQLEVVTLLPSYITGPIFLETMFTSLEGMLIIFKGKYPFLPLVYAN
jgi:hypothetical protein